MPVSYPCPAGHSSTDPEYCSECGKKLSGATATVSVGPAPSAPSTARGEVCPDCGTRRASPTAVFCEVCRYNFATGTPWTPGSLTAAPAAPADVVVDTAAAAAPDASDAPASVATGADALPDPVGWEVVVTVDPALYVDPDPAIPCPVGDPERTFPLDFAENLIGRRSDRRGIFPEIDLSADHGVSSRHAVLYHEANGSLTLLDVGSTNGTQVNGRDVVAGVRTPLRDGDQITIGCWTRMTVHGGGRGTGAS